MNHAISEQNFSANELASLLKAAADPLRLEILRVLARNSYGVMELASIFALKQSSMSHHLKVLASAGLVATRREGNSIFYRRALSTGAEAITATQRQLFDTVDLLPQDTEQLQKIELVQKERIAASQRFFSENAAKFREQADLIASFPVYQEQVIEALNNAKLPAQQLALELGPGEGELLPLLAERFERVYGVDNSAAMLAKSEQLVLNQQLGNVQLVLGDTREAIRQQLQADCVMVNMVLHHVPSPADIFTDLAQLMKPGAVLLVTDLCSHDQAWAKDNCGDLWLGFEPQDFTQWAADAGLTEGQSMYFALRNGFQIQIREFTKLLA